MNQKKYTSIISIGLCLSFLLCRFDGLEYIGIAFLFPLFLEEMKKIKKAFYALLCVFTYWIVPEMPQIWFWHLFLMLFFLSFSDNENLDKEIIKWALVACYFWGGFNKLNPWFAAYEFPLLLPFLKENTNLAYGVGLFEMSIGLAIIFSKTRTFALYLSLFFHTCIIFHLLKTAWNSVVLPWNICLPLLLFFLQKEKNKEQLDFKNPYATILNCSVILVFLILPFLQFFNQNFYPIAFNMYAGDEVELTIFFDKKDKKNLVSPSFQHLIVENDSICSLSYEAYSMAKYNVPPLSSTNHLKKIGESFLQNAQYKTSFYYEILEVKRYDSSLETFVKKVKN